jgi:hypothetical protein
MLTGRFELKRVGRFGERVIDFRAVVGSTDCLCSIAGVAGAAALEVRPHSERTGDCQIGRFW